jgi:uncharacterized protein (TIGR02246 family)
MTNDPVAEQLEAYNARDLERFLACYAPDVVVEDAVGNRMMEGMEALRATYSQLFANSPTLRAEVLNRIRAGEFVIDEERASGMNLPGMPPELHAAIVYRVRDGQIAHVRLLI